MNQFEYLDLLLKLSGKCVGKVILRIYFFNFNCEWFCFVYDFYEVMVVGSDLILEIKTLNMVLFEVDYTACNGGLHLSKFTGNFSAI